MPNGSDENERRGGDVGRRSMPELQGVERSLSPGRETQLARGRARERPRPRPRTAQSLFRKSATNLNYPVTGHQTAATADG